MRNLYDIIEKIILEIPKNDNSLVLSLRNIQNSLCFCAPESMYVWWDETANLLNDNVKYMTKKQFEKTRNIFNGE